MANTTNRDASTSGLSSLTWRGVDVFILVAYLFMTLLFSQLGYLDRPGDRIRGGDSDHYFVYLPALLLNGDLDFSHLIRDLGGDNAYLFPSDTDRAGNPYSIGPAVLWAPFFLMSYNQKVWKKRKGDPTLPVR